MNTSKGIWEKAAQEYERHGFTAAAMAARTPFSDLRNHATALTIVVNFGKLPGIINDKYPAYIRKTKIQFKESDHA